MHAITLVASATNMREIDKDRLIGIELATDWPCGARSVPSILARDGTSARRPTLRMSDQRPVHVFLVLTLGFVACRANDGGDDGADSGGESGSACEPGDVVACACADGTPGEQVCKAAGDGYWPCECGVSSMEGGSQSGSEGGSQSGSGTTSPSTGAGTDDGSASADTGGAACDSSHPIVEGARRFCAEDSCYCAATDACFAAATAQDCCDDDVLCGGLACEGQHPIVEGDMRYCEPGACYCGDADSDPALDACFAQDRADACCPVEVVCA